MAKFFHAHQIMPDICDGRMKCMRSCPTQAIRVKNSKAVIDNELCVDCGSCLSVCPTKAIRPFVDSLEQFSKYKYKVVVPTAVLYSQFDSSIHPYIIHLAFKELGFDEVIDLSFSSTVLAHALVKYLATYKGRRPIISSNCPALIRLIQVKYPDLVELISPLDVPRELTAREIKKDLMNRLDFKAEEIGIVYIAPCPAKIVSIKQPAEKQHSWFSNVISISDIYSLLNPHVIKIKEEFTENDIPPDFTFSTGWVRLGSIGKVANMDNYLSVSGLDHVMKVLDDIENSKIKNIDFLEAMTCMLGCLGGPFNVENLYVARTNVVKQRKKYETPIQIDKNEIAMKLADGYYFMEHAILPRPTKYFDTDIITSIKRMKERDRVIQKLPQIDCGCCGAPTCLAFAEDVVRGEAELTDCIMLTQEHIK